MKNLIKVFLIIIYLSPAFGGFSSLNIPKKEVIPKKSETEWDKEKNKQLIEKNEEIIKKGKEKLGGYPYGPSYLPPNRVQNLQAYLSHYACPQGRVPDITFSMTQFSQGSENTTQIQGQLQPTGIGGSPSNTYVGVNLGTRDVIYITKMTAEGRVIGFNISLSLCRLLSQPQTIYGGVGGYAPTGVSIPIIDVARMPVVGGATTFIVTDPTNCGMGSVDQGGVYLNIPAYKVPGTSAMIPAAQTHISFTRASCL